MVRKHNILEHFYEKSSVFSQFYKQKTEISHFFPRLDIKDRLDSDWAIPRSWAFFWGDIKEICRWLQYIGHEYTFSHQFTLAKD